MTSPSFEAASKTPRFVPILLNWRYRNIGVLRCRFDFLSQYLLAQQPLGGAVTHDFIVILEDGVDGEEPTPKWTDSKNVRQWYGFLFGVLGSIARLLL